MSVDMSVQLEIALRLLLAAVLGGLIGLEREIHAHPAGMRTHLLVSLGSAAFTILSIYGFPSGPGGLSTDPSRVAAQIVTGIGFLGAGAILKYGTTVKGLTTAASLWATAAVGMAAGAGAYLVAAVTTAIVLLSLWPLHAVAARLRLRSGRVIRVRLAVEDLTALGDLTTELNNRQIEIADIRTERHDDYDEIDASLRLPGGAVPAEVIRALASFDGVRLLGTERSTDE